MCKYNMSNIKLLSGEKEILASELICRYPALGTFSRLIYNGPRPLIGSLTLLFDNHALQYGSCSAEDTALLTELHRNTDLHTKCMKDGTTFTPTNSPENNSSERITPIDKCAEAQGFNLFQDDRGLSLDRNRRYPLPRFRDAKSGKWIDPVVKVNSPDFFLRLLTQRNLGLGEAFLEDQFQMLRGSVHHLIGFLLVNDIDRYICLPLKEKAKLLWQCVKWRLNNSYNENIADHYDIGDNIMVPMLGATGCYSCGYMTSETDNLDQMQLNKMNLIFTKMRLKPGMRILDTGCGNGGMLVHAALSWGCLGEGFTNSYNMASLAQRNVGVNNVADRVTIHHADFSILKAYPDEHFDAIYEVGVWEHLAFREYADIMKECVRILKPHGRMLIHSLGSHLSKHRRDGYIQKYIFRDSNQIRLHLLLNEASKHNMYVADVENLGRHYYWTLWHWRKNLIEAFERDQTINDRNFRIMLYFLECGMAESRFGDGTVYHILLFKDSRDYRKTWRVNGRSSVEDGFEVSSKPFMMKPSNFHQYLHNNQFAQNKFASTIYKQPNYSSKLKSLYHAFREVTHQ